MWCILTGGEVQRDFVHFCSPVSTVHRARGQYSRGQRCTHKPAHAAQSTHQRAKVHTGPPMYPPELQSTHRERHTGGPPRYTEAPLYSGRQSVLTGAAKYSLQSTREGSQGTQRPNPTYRVRFYTPPGILVYAARGHVALHSARCTHAGCACTRVRVRETNSARVRDGAKEEAAAV